jgi:hypothetical protein
LKIALGVNRWPLSDPEAVWRIGELPWRTILWGRNEIPLINSAAGRICGKDDKDIPSEKTLNYATRLEQ